MRGCLTEVKASNRFLSWNLLGGIIPWMYLIEQWHPNLYEGERNGVKTAFLGKESTLP